MLELYIDCDMEISAIVSVTKIGFKSTVWSKILVVEILLTLCWL